MGDKHTTSYLLLQQDPGIILQNLDLLRFIPCKVDLTSTPFCDTTIITYEIELPPAGNKIGLNLLNDEYFTIPYIIDKIKIHQQVINFQHRLRKMCGS